MKTFTFKHRWLAIISILILSGCSKDNSLFPSTENKLEGQWKYEKVRYCKDWAISGENLTEQYENLIIEFNSDNSLKQVDRISGLEKTGIWSLEEDTYYRYQAEGSQAQYRERLNASLIHPVTDELELLNWKNLMVTKRKITCIEEKDGGTYTYKLIKL
ncbi:MAG: hypothetical protein WD077_05540 [Bacteroidia bacterium]